jgi:hypothetical protein
MLIVFALDVCTRDRMTRRFVIAFKSEVMNEC